MDRPLALPALLDDGVQISQRQTAVIVMLENTRAPKANHSVTYVSLASSPRRHLPSVRNAPEELSRVAIALAFFVLQVGTTLLQEAPRACYAL